MTAILMNTTLIDDPAARLEANSPSADELIEAHKGLVYALAKRFENRGVEREELIQSGFLGLTSAVNRFDPNVGAAFSSYAFKFIEGSMRECARNNSLIPLPRSELMKLAELKAALAACGDELDERTRFSIAAKRLGIDTKELERRLISSAWTSNIGSIDALLEMEFGAQNAEQDSGKNGGLSVCFEDETIESMDARALLETLDENEKAVLVQRYLNDKRQSEIALLLGSSQANISKIEKRALAKLRSSIEKSAETHNLRDRLKDYS